MLKAIIIDDETSNRELLSIMVKDFCPSIRLLGTADSIHAGLSLIQSVSPDIVFLDIEMPGGSGFDLLKKIPDRKFEVIFTTAYNQYALQALKFSAIDYLLKPIDLEELIAAVDKVKMRKSSGVAPDYEMLRTILENLPKKEEAPEKLIIPDQNGFTVVPLKEVVRLSAEGSYTEVVMLDGRKYVSSRSLGTFEEMIAPAGFIRIHHSHLINLTHVVKYNKGRGGTVTMTDGQELEVSRRKKDEFLQAMGIGE